jgi:malate/lactate dehydrogenase
VEAIARRARADRVLGSAPIAHSAALRLRLAHELGVERADVTAMALGSPPQDAVVPAALVGGQPLDRLSPVALRRALQGLERRALGPVALAAAAARAIRALHAARESVQAVLVVLAGEYGQRGLALTVPARIGRGRVAGILELPLDPSDRLRFERAAERRSVARAPRS